MYVTFNSLQHQTYDSEQLNVYIVKKNMHKSQQVIISISPAQFRMSYNLLQEQYFQVKSECRTALQL